MSLPGAWFPPGPIPGSYNEPDTLEKSGVFLECLIKYLTMDVGRVYRWTKRDWIPSLIVTAVCSQKPGFALGVTMTGRMECAL